MGFRAGTTPARASVWCLWQRRQTIQSTAVTMAQAGGALDDTFGGDLDPILEEIAAL
jgi:hypothetical protein